MAKMPRTHHPRGQETRYAREARPNSHRMGYTRKWSKARADYLQRNPLCVFCLAKGKTTPANVVDHVQPHKGNQELFWLESNWCALCKKCHDSDKRKIEHAARRQGMRPGPP